MKKLLWLLLLGLAALLKAEEPLLTVQVDHAAALLGDFQQSLYRDFVASKAEETFSRSKLYLKFTEAAAVYQGLSSTVFRLDQLRKLARQRALLHLYNVRELQFFAALEMEEKDYQLSRFFLERSKFKTFSHAGLEYFLRTDNEGKKYFCFFFADRLLLLSNSPRAMESQLEKIKAGGKIFCSDGENLAEKTFDIFMRFTPAILDSPYFQSYWYNPDILRLKKEWQSAEVFLTAAPKKISEIRYYHLKKSPEKILSLGGESIPDGDLVLMSSDPGEIDLLLRDFVAANRPAGLNRPQKLLLVKKLDMDARLVLHNRHWLKLACASAEEAGRWKEALAARLELTSRYLEQLAIEQKGVDVLLRTQESPVYHVKPLGANTIAYGFLRLDKVIANSLSEIAAAQASPEFYLDDRGIFDNLLKPLLGILKRVASIEKYSYCDKQLLKQTVVYQLKSPAGG
jgi:hypothetical protein